MDSSSRPGSPTGGPLQAVTPDRINRRDSIFSSLRSEGGRDSSVHDKINQFNNLSIAMQSKQMERKTADAALKRAMVGREEAEAEIRRLREESKILRKHFEEGKERERKVGERLETVMDNYGRAKETHSHTQALWEKEIRRARKENFKSQSAIVKLQEELKSARSTVKTLQENLQHEKERSKVREQEAFTARYQIVGVQEQLDEAMARIKVVEQERDAFKTAAKNEEVARIAAEGRIPLPASHDPTDEFASPTKKGSAPTKRQSGPASTRVSLSSWEIMSSASSEMEIEELTTRVLWERQRADRAQEMIEFLQAECQMHCCPCSKTQDSRKCIEAPQKRRRVSVEQAEEQPVKEKPDSPPSQRASSHGSPHGSVHVEDHQAEGQSQPEKPDAEEDVEPQEQRIKSRKEPRRSTIFYPKEGIFRTVSEQEAAALEAEERIAAEVDLPIYEEQEEQEEQDEPEEPIQTTEQQDVDLRMYARTPSVEPPAFALVASQRTSLDSLLNAPLDEETEPAPLLNIPSVPVVAESEVHATAETDAETEEAIDDDMELPAQQLKRSSSPRASPDYRPHTSTASYTVTTTVPLREDTARSSSSFNERLRTPSHGSNASFDMNDPAMTPTMTREQALAKIRERRGRARSAAQSATAPGKKMATTAAPTTGPRGRPAKRDMSAPTPQATSRSRIRS